MKTADSLTHLSDMQVDPWTLKVCVLGAEGISDARAALARRHITEKLAGVQKPSPAGTKAVDDTGVAGTGFVLFSQTPDMYRVFLGIKLKTGASMILWEISCEETPPEKHDLPMRQCFTGGLPNLYPAELAALAELAS